MISELVSALLAVTISVTTYANTTQPTQTYAQETPTTTPQVRQVDTRRESQTNQTRNTTIGTNSTQDVQNQICQVFKENCQEALKVASCESGLRPQAVSQTQDYGVFQINLSSHASKIPVRDKVGYLLNSSANINLAYSIWSNQGWRPWRYSKHCHGVI